jgi:glutaredoxin
MSVIHKILGALILFFDWVFTPRTIKRDAQAQAEVEAKVTGIILYQYRACPFCVKVRRAMKRNGIIVELRDAKRSEAARDQLVAGSGKLKVPCLRTEENNEVRWIFDSSDIIAYLENLIAA